MKKLISLRINDIININTCISKKRMRFFLRRRKTTLAIKTYLLFAKTTHGLGKKKKVKNISMKTITSYYNEKRFHFGERKRERPTQLTRACLPGEVWLQPSLHIFANFVLFGSRNNIIFLLG